MKYYAVIDTNVIVSALLKRDSTPGTIVHFALDGRIIPVLNESILKEYREVLSRPKFKFSLDTIRSVLADLMLNGVFVGAAETDEFFIDLKDKVFYEVVMEKRKNDDAYLVTGNIKHFPVKPFVVTPREMLEIIQSGD